LWKRWRNSEYGRSSYKLLQTKSWGFSQSLECKFRNEVINYVLDNYRDKLDVDENTLPK